MGVLGQQDLPFRGGELYPVHLLQAGQVFEPVRPVKQRMLRPGDCVRKVVVAPAGGVVIGETDLGGQILRPEPLTPQAENQ